MFSHNLNFSIHFSVVSCVHQQNENQNKCMEKFKLLLDTFVCSYMPQTLAISSSLKTLRFSVHSTFETRLLLKIFDAEFPYKLSYFEPLCLPAKMAAETMIRSIWYCFETLLFNHTVMADLKSMD